MQAGPFEKAADADRDLSTEQESREEERVTERITRYRIRRGGSRAARAAALAVCALITAAFLAPLFAVTLPDYDAGEVSAETAGGDLEVRVGYFGDDRDYRTKAVLSRGDLESLAQTEGSQTYQYSNVTRVGTVMGTIARGPTIYAVLDAAGIDANSVQTINLRTTDGKKVNNWFVSLNMNQWVNSTRYYYPYLRGNYERVEDADGSVDQEEGGMVTGAVRPGAGALRGRTPVPAILAIESFSTKDPDEAIDASMMDESVSYRFCAGQTAMAEETDCRDYSSMNSAQWVFGIDVTLFGTPDEASDLDLTAPAAKDLVVGSKAQIGYQIYGQDLFGDKVNGALSWKSSNPAVARVDQNGVVTILKAGTVKITATTANGISRSVTIRCLAKKKNRKQEEPEQKEESSEKKRNTNVSPVPKTVAKDHQYISTVRKTENRRDDEKEKKSREQNRGRAGDEPEREKKQLKAGMREILIEGMSEREEMSAAATPLDAQKRSPFAGAVALSGTGVCAAAGGVLRLLAYLKEVR